MRRTGKVTAGILTGLLCFAAVAGGLSRSQARDGQPSLQRDNAPAEGAGQEKVMPAKGGGMSSEEKTVRDVYARLMRYHTAARDEASANSGVIYNAADYVTFGVNDLKTGSIEEIFHRSLPELVTPRGGEIINLKPNYLRGADGLAHASYDAAWETLSDEGNPDQTGSPTVLQAGGGKYNDAVKYTSYEVTVSLEGKRRTYQAIALHFSPGGADGKPATEILDNITSDMNAVLAERSPRIRSPWARYVRSNLHNAIVDSIREKEQAGLPLIPVDAPIGYLPGDEIEAANSPMVSAANNCEPEPPPLSVTISDVKAVIKDGFADFQVTLDPSPSNVSVTLDLTTTGGTGQALFDASNSSSLTITQSSIVRVKGVNESSAVNNIQLMARTLFFPLATKNFTVIKAQLKEVAFANSSVFADFTDSSLAGLRKDDNTATYTAPHWQDNSSPLDGDADDSGDRKYPMAYVKSNIAKVSVTLIIRPSVSLDGVTISVRGEGPGNLDFPAKSVTTSAGSSGDRLVISDLSTPSNISSAVECINCPAFEPFDENPEGIKWEISVAQPTGAPTWKDLGTTRNRIYVLNAKPVITDNKLGGKTAFLESLAYISCKAAKGAATPTNIFNNIWTTFVNKKVFRVDGEKLKYYNPMATVNVFSETLIRDGNGQCGSFAKLLIDLMRVQGVNSAGNYLFVERLDVATLPDKMSYGFYVKSWTFTTAAGKSGDTGYPYLNVWEGTPYNLRYAQVTDNPGIEGQGSSNPASIFQNHQFVLWGGKAYDPSYGVIYESAPPDTIESIFQSKLDAFHKSGIRVVSEAALDTDINLNGTKTDILSVPTHIIKRVPSEMQIKMTTITW